MGFFKQQQIKCEDAGSHYNNWLDQNSDNLYREWMELRFGPDTKPFSARMVSFDEYLDSCYDLYCYPDSNKLPG